MSQVTDNTAEARYELVEAGETVYADYRLEGDIVHVDYVFAPPVLRGTGASGRLMQGLVADVRSKGLKIAPHCGYAAAWLKRHPDTVDLLR